mmetsp:Transcript_62085/g.201280  ORF Transcript_62085/g.201280 Transcript_62085/m.201280 type:complete len:248 (+) Transcript_62085:108-851(+)
MSPPCTSPSRRSNYPLVPRELPLPLLHLTPESARTHARKPRYPGRSPIPQTGRQAAAHHTKRVGRSSWRTFLRRPPGRKAAKRGCEAQRRRRAHRCDTRHGSRARPSESRAQGLPARPRHPNRFPHRHPPSTRSAASLSRCRFHWGHPRHQAQRRHHRKRPQPWFGSPRGTGFASAPAALHRRDPSLWPSARPSMSMGRSKAPRRGPVRASGGCPCRCPRCQSRRRHPLEPNVPRTAWCHRSSRSRR